MGYHVIIRINETSIKSIYVDTYEKLAGIAEIKDDSIIYQGEKEWVPVVVGDSCYNKIAKDWYRAGMKAQQVFKVQAAENDYMLETISQDQESFVAYTNCTKKSIKRGDFIIRNVGNLEIEVKCRTFMREKYKRYFDFSVEDFDKHLAMISITRTPIVVAVYQRLDKTDRVKENQLFMFSITEIQKELNKIRIVNRKDVTGKFCYRIPLSLTKKGFKLIESYKEKINKNEVLF